MLCSNTIANYELCAQIFTVHDNMMFMNIKVQKPRGVNYFEKILTLFSFSTENQSNYMQAFNSCHIYRSQTQKLSYRHM